MQTQDMNGKIRAYALGMTDTQGAAYLLALIGEREAMPTPPQINSVTLTEAERLAGEIADKMWATLQDQINIFGPGDSNQVVLEVGDCRTLLRLIRSRGAWVSEGEK